MDRAMAFLRDFGLEDRATYFPSQLSGGQRQRVAIIQQLLCSDHYLVMDEPFTGLDPLMKDKTCDLIMKVSQMHEKNTIFIVAHDIPALVTVSDTLWLLGRDHDKDGKPIQGSRIQQVYDLAAMGLAWHPELADTRDYQLMVKEVKERFKTL
jgi:ABC-type nitrate/sulfonate/bicarbonate transport system ATPase subunit